jgi:hypothetical protein
METYQENIKANLKSPCCLICDSFKVSDDNKQL